VALGAHSGEFKDVAQVTKSVGGGNVMSPALEFRGVNFNGGPTASTVQVVVVRLDDAAAIERLAAIGHDDVNLAPGGHLFELGVHRGQGNLAPGLNNEVVELLGRDEAPNARESLSNLSFLGGIAGGDHVSSVVATELQFGMILNKLTGMVLDKRVAVALLSFSLALMGTTAASASPRQPIIVSGVSQWAALASQEVGGSFGHVSTHQPSVISLLSDPNADPHEHEATVRDATLVHQASLVIVNGAGYDTWLSKLTQSDHSVVLNVSSLTHTTVGHNPHLFYSLAAAIDVATALRQRLGAVAVHASVVLSQLHSLQRVVASIHQRCSGVPIAATEDVGGYLESDMGLNVVTSPTFRLAVGNGVDPSVAATAQALASITKHDAFIVDNLQTVTPLTNQLIARATSLGVPVIRLRETEVGANYVTFMSSVIRQMQGALHREGCWR
jgi:zinc/manganese transport system substrate-binding protein